MEKKDFKKIYKELYTASITPKLVTVPPLQFISITGEGNPNTSKMFADAVTTLFPVAYTLKFMIKKGETPLSPADYNVMPLEAQWWADNMEDFISRNKDTWKWKVQLFMPDFVTEEILALAIEKVRKKKSLAMLDSLKLETISEGTSAQIMHFGSYDTEMPTIQALHSFIKANGGKLSGLHREIYLNDFRKVAPEKLKTIIRQPYINLSA